MKLLLSICVILIIIVSTSFANDTTHFNILNREEDPVYHKQRKAWIQNMNLTEQGVDYKLLKREVLKSRSNYINENRKKIDYNSPFLQDYTSDDDKISGKWIERGSNNQAGRIHIADIDFEQGYIYAASAGGNIWKGTIEGKDWVCLNNSQQFSIFNIKVERINGKLIIFVFDGTGVYYSNNDGFTWERSKGFENLATWGSMIRGSIIRVGDELRIYALVQEWDYTEWKQIRSLYYSNDNGKNFDKLLSVDGTPNIDIWGYEMAQGEYSDPNITYYNKLIFLHQDSIFSVDKDVRTLLNTNKDILSYNPSQVRICANQIGNKVLLYINVNDQQNNLQIFSTTDFGKNLKYMGTSPTNYFRNTSFAVSKLDENWAMIGGVECYQSYDGAANWQSTNPWGAYYGDPENKLHADIPGIKSFRTSQTEEFFIICTDGGLYRTNNKYFVKNLSLSKLNVSQYYSIYSYYGDEEIIFAGAQDQGFQRSKVIIDESPLNFDQLISGDYSSLSSGDNGKSIWCVYPGFAMIFSEATINSNYAMWQFTGSSQDRVWMPPIVAKPNDPFVAYTAPGSANGGSKIIELKYNASQSSINATELPFQFDKGDSQNDVSALAISKINTNYLYAATMLGKFFSSTNKGSSWTETPNFSSPGYNYLAGTCIYPSNIDLGTVYVSGSGYSAPGVFVSYDNGKTFEPLEGLPPCFVYQIALTPEEDVIFAATSVGPYVYIKSSKKWYDIAGLDAPQQDYWSVNYIPQTKVARFATYGRGIWDFKIDKLITDVKDNSISELDVLNVYPNPSSEQINIKFSAPMGEKVKVKIIDLEGKLINTCFDDIINSKENNIALNLSQISNISSGSYLVIMSYRDNLKYKKINVLR